MEEVRGVNLENEDKGALPEGPGYGEDSVP